MQKTYKHHSSRWSLYLVAIAFGIVCSFTLVYITWHKALDNNHREFSLASVVLKNTVFNNVRAAHNALNSLATFFIADKDFNKQEFSVLSDDMLEQFPHIEGIAVYPFTPAIAYSENNRRKLSSFQEHCPVFYQTMRNAKHSQDIILNIAIDERYQEIMMALINSNSIIAVAIPGDNNKSKDYWMFKLLRSNDLSKGYNEQTLLGLAGVFVKTDRLLGTMVSNSDLSLTMLNDAAGFSGRQILYNTPPPDREQNWVVTSLTEDGVTQFPMYSIKLAISKDVGWLEVEKHLVYAALIIGIGVTLLLVALVRVKDLQAKQLRERNIFVERQVEEQTKELALARDEAIEASRVKSAFLAGMSHEIRTPLNAIIGMSELLSETPVSNEQKNYISVFKKAGDTLLSLVNDILDLSKIEANQLALEDIEFDLLETVEECTEIYALKAAEKKIELLSCAHNDLTNRRKGDAARLRQIILNLIGNALKFTERGEIVVRAQRFSETDNDDTVLFSVSDTGIGIPKEKLETIFASFTQADSSTTRKYGGTGLGLTISRSLVEMMNGMIWVESEEGKGSVFQFTVKLPVVPPDEKTSAHNKIDLKNKKLFLVDDNAIRSEILTSYLAAANAEVAHAPAGHAALETLASTAGSFALLLLDLGISDLDSLELVEAIKQNHEGLPIIVMLQAAELNQHMDRLKKIGVDSYLIKPLKKSDLLHKVHDLLFITGQDTHTAKKTPVNEKAIKPLNILLVDDNPDNVLLIKAYLKNLPYTLDEAENGQIAFEKFRQTDYDLVLMDVQMPVMDGHQAMQAIRSWEAETAREASCVIALTAHAFKEEIDKCFASGCDTYLNKPVKKTQLVDTIQSMTA